MQSFVFNANERRGHDYQNKNIFHVYLFKAIIFDLRKYIIFLFHSTKELYLRHQIFKILHNLKN